MRFPRTQRLRLQGDFMRVRREGLRADAGVFILNAAPPAARAAKAVPVPESPPAPLPAARVGVVSAKKLLGDAVHRNRMRRVFKEIFRLNPGVWPAGWDVVLVPRRGALKKSFASLERRYLESARRLLANEHR